MPIVQQGSINTTALVVPDLYVQIVPPQNLVLNGVPTNVLGVVGFATWGPVGQGVEFGDYQSFTRTFGTVQNRRYDLGTAVAIAVQQGASAFVGVRVSDGTDVAAGAQFAGVATAAPEVVTLGGTWAPGDTYQILVNLAGVLIYTVNGGYVTGGPGPMATQAQAVLNAAPIMRNSQLFTGLSGSTLTIYGPGGGAALTVTASKVSTSGTIAVSAGSPVTAAASAPSKWTGSAGNVTTVTFYASARANSTDVAITGPGRMVERYNGLQNGQFWIQFDQALRYGNGFRGPSQILAGLLPGYNFAVGLPTYGVASTYNGGTDGMQNSSSAMLVGVDGAIGARTGMYVLRDTGCSVGMLCDLDDSTQWTTIDGFGLSEDIYMQQVVPEGTTIAAAVTAKVAAGLDSYGSKLLHGDWIYWNDPVNQLVRLVSPQAFAAGRLANLSPEQSSLNKPLYGVVGTQNGAVLGSAQFTPYSESDLQTLFGAGIDVITNPQPGGDYFGVRCGHNSSSNAAINGDNYTRMTNYIAATLDAGMGQYVGKVINAKLFQQIRATLLSYFANLLGQGLLGTLDGSLPYGVVCDTSNNPLSRTSLGYVQADCQVQYQGINEKFIVNVEGGQTVQVQRQTLPAGQAGQ